jgi:putative flippase GtrA
MIRRTKDLYLRLDERYPTHTKLFRYAVSGGTAFGTNVLFLFLFTDIFGVWYLASAVFAFILAFFVSFLLHKFWTFGDHSRDGMHAQMGGYFAVALVNLALNTLLVYVFVERASLHYLVAQMLASLLIAMESFFVYQHVIFRKKTA